MTVSGPPYQRIAADLRRRITGGELAPGDRLPSTRQIARDWNVALATATKVLALLHAEGLVRARPRVGTVVAGAPEPAPSAGAGAGQPAGGSRQSRTGTEHELTRQRVVRAGIEIADTEGLDGLSMRGVAARLGVSAMSPYRYVDGKEHLVVLMADEAYGEEGYPDAPPPDWRAHLELVGRTLWRLHRRHPWLAQVTPLTRPLPLANLATHADRSLAALDGLGFTDAEMLDRQILLYAHVQGLATHLESEARAAATSGLSDEEWMERQGPAMDAMVTSGRYPTFGRVLGTLTETGYDLDLDALFELGLGYLLDSVAADSARRQRGAAPA
ncbi:TetR/AcrR family transcriptional regulator C-terminal domain-containing protein [Rugosimonospora africana]|uniref:GntR family transcriptional regulator n=1 Tax=Rugosimonospora africana TaxID=556532 RepID=A0A8J3QZS9_9ACTN|nr:TetR/AcrR family transcriptional regulator C-terminal domain-containing protein [Rugosimonospora africana]GIH19244.1 GntR family transcriptional regulator [Rugosimonospora africana]